MIRQGQRRSAIPSLTKLLSSLFRVRNRTGQMSKRTDRELARSVMLRIRMAAYTKYCVSQSHTSTDARSVKQSNNAHTASDQTTCFLKSSLAANTRRDGVTVATADAIFSSNNATSTSPCLLNSNSTNSNSAAAATGNPERVLLLLPIY